MFCIFIKVFLDLMSTTALTKKILEQFECQVLFHKSLMSTAKVLYPELDIVLIVFVIEKGLTSIYCT